MIGLEGRWDGDNPMPGERRASGDVEDFEFDFFFWIFWAVFFRRIEARIILC